MFWYRTIIFYLITSLKHQIPNPQLKLQPKTSKEMKTCLHLYTTLITMFVLRQTSPVLIINGGDCWGRNPHILCLFTEKAFQVPCGLKTQASRLYFMSDRFSVGGFTWNPQLFNHLRSVSATVCFTTFCPTNSRTVWSHLMNSSQDITRPLPGLCDWSVGCKGEKNRFLTALGVYLRPLSM